MNDLSVEVVPHILQKRTRWGVVDVQHGLSYVKVNGSSAGYVPIDGPYKGVFHPMPGFPRELCEEVVKASGGALRGSLKPPKRAQLPDEQDDILDGDDEA